MKTNVLFSARIAVLGVFALVVVSVAADVALAQDAAPAASELPAFKPPLPMPAPVLAPPVPSPETSALPAAGGVDPRAPGMRLPSSGTPVNPFAAATADPAQPTPEEIEANIRKQAFDAAVTGLMPLKPEEIRKLLQYYDQTRQAVETPLYPSPEPEIVVETIPLDPGSKPTVLKTATGHVTMVMFHDVTGEPWPIANITWAGNFEVTKPERGGHAFSITPMSEFAHGNAIITLLQLKSPVVFSLETRRDKVHYRFEAQIPEEGPFAAPPIIGTPGGSSPATTTLAAGGNKELSSVLDGVAPDGSEKLAVEGVDGRTTAYRQNETTYVRTPLTLLSPAWQSSVTSADGMNVYALSDASVLLLSDDGEMVRARLSKEEKIDGE